LLVVDGAWRDRLRSRQKGSGSLANSVDGTNGVEILRTRAHSDGSLDAVISESPFLKITDWRMRVCKNLTRS